MGADYYGFWSTTVIGAAYTPGFELELLGWRLMVDTKGHMSQVLDHNLHQHALKKAPWTVIQLDEDLILDWLIRLDALDFAALEALERRVCVDDFGVYTLYCRFAGMHKGITLRSLELYLMQGQPEMVAFRQVWDAIHAVAPIERTRRHGKEEGRREKEEMRAD